MKGASFGSSVLIGLWLVPYLVGHLGMAAYGMVPLAAVFTQYVGVIANALKMPVARFMTLAYRGGGGARKDSLAIFNTAFFAYLGLAVFQIPFFALGFSFLNEIFTIPPGILWDTKILLFCSLLSYLISFVGSVFGVATFANNRVDVDEGINTARIILKVVLLVFIFTKFSPALRYVGYVELFVAVFVLTCKVVAWRRLMPDLRINLHLFQFERIRPILGMSIWILISNFGSLLFLRANVWIINKFISAEAAGQYGALMKWDALLRSATAMASVVIAPMVMIYYSKKQFEDAARITQYGVKFLTLGMAVPCALIVGFSPQVLSLWLGPEYVSMWPILSAMMFLLYLNCGVTPIFQIQNAYNKVKLPAVMSLLMGVLNAVACIIAIVYFNQGILGVVVVTTIVLTLKNVGFTLWYAAHITGFSIHSFVRPALSSVVLNLLVLAGACLLKDLFDLDNVLVFLSVSGALGLFAYTLCVWLFIKEEERKVLINMLKRSKVSQGNQSV